VNGIPHAFIVDKEGHIVWHGHPMGELEQTLDAVLARKYDLTKEKKRTRPARRSRNSCRSAGRRQREGPATGQELENLDEEIGG